MVQKHIETVLTQYYDFLLIFSGFFDQKMVGFLFIQIKKQCLGIPSQHNQCFVYVHGINQSGTLQCDNSFILKVFLFLRLLSTGINFFKFLSQQYCHLVPLCHPVIFSIFKIKISQIISFLCFTLALIFRIILQYFLFIKGFVDYLMTAKKSACFYFKINHLLLFMLSKILIQTGSGFLQYRFCEIVEISKRVVTNKGEFVRLIL
eukprot:TRINITY_DN4197_c1_g1_i3.p1 TRINITY_DN4197_c1_g1~~TRINITY_DN4197_c1_g1_i3.p1  ORF type:complete len:205 (-),score=-24.16 TRINITY_DN4197_c1_g1_i3:138-752(-)